MKSHQQGSYSGKQNNFHRFPSSVPPARYLHNREGQNKKPSTDENFPFRLRNRCCFSRKNLTRYVLLRVLKEVPCEPLDNLVEPEFL